MAAVVETEVCVLTLSEGDDTVIEGVLADVDVDGGARRVKISTEDADPCGNGEETGDVADREAPDDVDEEDDDDDVGFTLSKFL